MMMLLHMIHAVEDDVADDGDVDYDDDALDDDDDDDVVDDNNNQ